jgi:enoyl-CoA hydratase/carnithine racemase
MSAFESVAQLAPLLQTIALAVDADHHILTITLNRPARRNGFNVRMSDELVAAFVAADLDASVRVIVLTGAGDFFCAGADLDPTADFSSPDQSRPLLSPALNAQLDRVHTNRDLAGRVVLAMLACRKVTVAALNGTAVGVGITMVLSADFRFVPADAKIGFVFVRRGLAPEGCSTVLLPRLVGHTRASDWILSGRVFPASEAADSGLFTRVLPHAADVLPAALECARTVALQCSPVQTMLARALCSGRVCRTPISATHTSSSPRRSTTPSRPTTLPRESSPSSRSARRAFPEQRQQRRRLCPSFYPWWTSLQVEHPLGGVRPFPKL